MKEKKEDINIGKEIDSLIKQIIADKKLSAPKKIEALELATRAFKNLCLR